MCAVKVRNSFNRSTSTCLRQYLSPTNGSKILNSQSHCKIQWLQAKGLCNLQIVVQTFISIVSRRHVRLVVEQLQNWSQSVHLLVSMPLQCDSAGLPVKRRDRFSHVCLWAGPVTCFGQQDAVERPLCQFLLTFTLSL